jgi:hypothetical protein
MKSNEMSKLCAAVSPRWPGLELTQGLINFFQPIENMVARDGVEPRI